MLSGPAIQLLHLDRQEVELELPVHPPGIGQQCSYLDCLEIGPYSRARQKVVNLIMKQKTFFGILFCQVFLSHFFAQKETNHWYFSQKAALDFSGGSPLSINNSVMLTSEGSSSLSDGSGNLLFYTNGVNIWNKSHSIMANGNALDGSNSSTQSALAIKKPGSLNQYYVFTTGAFGTGNLSYSVIDMNLAAGMGSVTVKNYSLSTNMTEKLCATRHCNGQDVWILAHKYNSNEFHTYLITSSGVNPVPIVSSVGSIHAVQGGSNNASYAGMMKIAPSGLKLGCVVFGSPSLIELFDFNTSNGNVSNPIVLSSTLESYGCEFSPDATKFYATESYNGNLSQNAKIHQWNLCAGSLNSILASQTVVAVSSLPISSYWSMQLAADGRLYVVQNSLNALNYFLYPNNLGTACGFVPLTPALNTGTCQLGLPNFLSNPFKEKGTYDTLHLTCGSYSFTARPPGYCAGLNYSVNAHQWNFGDPISAVSNTSNLNTVVHNFSSNGTYTVRLVNYYNCSSDTLQKVIVVNDFPNLTVNGKTSMCKGETLNLNFSGASTYSLNSQVMTQNTISLQPTVTTVYTLSGANSQSGCTASKSFTLNVLACVGIGDVDPENNDIIVYPNPFHQSIELNCDLKGEVFLYNSLGDCVRHFHMEKSTEVIETNDLPSGVYFLRLVSEDGTQNRKLVKSN